MPPVGLSLSRRRRAVALVIVLGAAAIIAVLLLPAEEEPATSAPVAAEEAEASARRACDLLAQLFQQASTNAAGGDVVGTAGRAREAAERAARADPKWVQLSSATQAIEDSLTRDDPALAATGVRVARVACSRPAAVEASASPESDR